METLKLLGLTQVQAKVYMTLLKTKNSGIKDLAKLSRVSRPDMYRVISDLEKRGLVEKEIATPLKVRAIPLQEGVETLLDIRNRESDEIKEKTAALLKSPTNMNRGEFPEECESHFFLIPSNRAIKKIGQAIETAQKSIDVFVTWNRLLRGLEFFSELNEKAKARKVKIRIIVDKPDKEVAQKGIDIFEHPVFEVKFSLFRPTVILGIYDEKEVSIAAIPEVELEDSPLLWSDNNALVALARDYFEKSWLTGKGI